MGKLSELSIHLYIRELVGFEPVGSNPGCVKAMTYKINIYHFLA